MKSMQQMQMEMLSRCYKKDGWPKPVIIGFGVVRIAKDQEELEKIRNDDMKAWKYAVITVGLLIAAVVWLNT